MGFHSMLNLRSRRLLLSFALVCTQITAGSFALKDAKKPGAQFDKGSAGDCGMHGGLWEALLLPR